MWCEKCLGTGEVKENGGKWSGLGWTKGQEEETEILHLPRNNWPSFYNIVLIFNPQSAKSTVHVS